MIRLVSGIFLGWGLGANDSANIFGTAVSSRMVRYRTATILAALFVITGALLQGGEGMHTISGLAESHSGSASTTAVLTSTAAAITVLIMTILRLPISTSQAVVGAILGHGLITGATIDISSLIKIGISWLATPLGGLFFTFLFYGLFRAVIRLFRLDTVALDGFLRSGLIVAGCYGAYALGANNVANVTGMYVGSGSLTVSQAVLLGGFSIALGIVTYSKNVMFTVGKGILPLDAFSALVTVVAHAVTVHIFAILGVPVSTSQAIVGAVVGIGIIRNIEAINYRVVGRILSGWFFTPITAALIATLLTSAVHFLS